MSNETKGPKQHSQHRLRTPMSEGEDKGAMKPKGPKQHSQHRLRTPMSEGEDKGAMKPKGLNSIVNID